MTNEQKLKEAFEDTIWMAIRYADGRHTHAPSMVRNAVKKFQTVFPDWKPKEDSTIKPPEEEDLGGISFRGDYLHDILQNTSYL